MHDADREEEQTGGRMGRQNTGQAGLHGNPSICHVGRNTDTASGRAKS